METIAGIINNIRNLICGRGTGERFRALLLLPFAFAYACFIVLGDWQSSAHYSNLANLWRLFLWTALCFPALLGICVFAEKRKRIFGKLRRRETDGGIHREAAGQPQNRSCQRAAAWSGHFPRAKAWNGCFPEAVSRRGSRFAWPLFSLLCLLCYLPYFLMYYPGWNNNDAVWQMEQIFGLAARSNHHPYFHTLLMGAFLRLGLLLFGSLTAASAFYAFSQMAVTAAAFGFYLSRLYRQGAGFFWLIPAAAFYALLPVNGLYSICLGKDAWFTAAFLFFAWAAHVCAGAPERAPAGMQGEAQEAALEGAPEREAAACRRRWLLFFVTGLSVCLLRSNGILVFFGTAVFLNWFIWRRDRRQVGDGLACDGQTDANQACSEQGGDAQTKRRKTFSEQIKRQMPPGVQTRFRETGHRQDTRVAWGVTAAVLAAYLLWQGPVLRALQVEPPDLIEGLTMPTQQLLCAYVRGGTLTEAEVAMLERVTPLSAIDEYYNPYLFDMTKNYIRKNGNQEAIRENLPDYAVLWLRVGLRNPMLYVEGFIRQTAGYYALRIPHEQLLYGEYFTVENPFGIEGERKLFTYEQSLAMGDFLQKFQRFYVQIFSLGANTWLFLLCLACALYRKRRVLLWLPGLMLLMSLLLAAPVYNEFRYAYGLFVSLPLLLWEGFSGEGRAR